MYTINNPAVAERIESCCRTWRMWIEGADGSIITDGIVSANNEMQSTSLNDDIELGAVCAQSWTIRINGIDTNFLGKEYKLYFYLIDYVHRFTTYADLEKYTFGILENAGVEQMSHYGDNSGSELGKAFYSDLENFTYTELSNMAVRQIKNMGSMLGFEKIPLGKFICVKSKKKGGSTDVTFADRLYFSNKVYKPKINLPAWGRAIENDICQQLGIENGNDYATTEKLKEKSGARLYEQSGIRLETANFDIKITSIPEKATMRQMLSYIASAQGQFGFVDRFGRYVRKWYGRSVKLLDNNMIDTPTIGEKQNVIMGVICKVSNDQTLQYGAISGSSVSGWRILEFENPYMTDSLLQSLWTRIYGYSWYTAELYHRLGDPRFDIGDVVTYDNGAKAYDIPITKMNFTFDGGLSADISAVGLSVEEQL